MLALRRKETNEKYVLWLNGLKCLLLLCRIDYFCFTAYLRFIDEMSAGSANFTITLSTNQITIDTPGGTTCEAYNTLNNICCCECCKINIEPIVVMVHSVRIMSCPSYASFCPDVADLTHACLRGDRVNVHKVWLQADARTCSKDSSTATPTLRNPFLCTGFSIEGLGSSMGMLWVPPCLASPCVSTRVVFCKTVLNVTGTDQGHGSH